MYFVDLYVRLSCTHVMYILCILLIYTYACHVYFMYFVDLYVRLSCTLVMYILLPLEIRFKQSEIAHKHPIPNSRVNGNPESIADGTKW